MNQEIYGLGVDLGSRYTLLAKSNGQVTDVLLTEQHQRETENIIVFKDNERLFGDQAIQKYRMNILNSIKGFTQISVIKHRGQELQLLKEQQIGAFLRKFINNKQCPIVISYPDFYTQKELIQLWRGIQISKLNVISTIPENLAIKQYLIYCQNIVQNRNVIIIDFGHQKFSSFLLQNDQIICQVFDRNLGTNLMDQYLANWIKQKANINLDQKQWLKLLDSCEQIRKSLSANTSYKIEIENIVQDVDFIYLINIQEYEQIIQPIIKRIDELCFNLLSQAINYGYQSVNLMGGGSRIPCFQNSVKNIFGVNQIQNTINATEAICQGCAISSVIINQTNQIYELFEHYPIYIGYTINQIQPKLDQIADLREYYTINGTVVKFQNNQQLQLPQGAMIQISLFYLTNVDQQQLIRSYQIQNICLVSFYYDRFGIVQMQSNGQIILPIEDQNEGLLQLINIEDQMEKDDNEIYQLHYQKNQFQLAISQYRDLLKQNNYNIRIMEKAGTLLEEAEDNIHDISNQDLTTINKLIQQLHEDFKQLIN